MRGEHIVRLYGVPSVTRGKTTYLTSRNDKANLHSIIAALQNKTPDLEIPSVPRLFHEGIDPYLTCENVDLFGQPYTSASFRPPFAPGLLNAACDLNILQNEIMHFNENASRSNYEADFPTRKMFYNKVLAWRKSLPNHLWNESNYTPGTSLLRFVVLSRRIVETSLT